jgi:hypothetical protein
LGSAVTGGIAIKLIAREMGNAMNYLADCLQADNEEYEAWLSRQGDYTKGSDLEGRTVPEVGAV